MSEQSKPTDDEVADVRGTLMVMRQIGDLLLQKANGAVTHVLSDMENVNNGLRSKASTLVKVKMKQLTNRAGKLGGTVGIPPPFSASVQPHTAVPPPPNVSLPGGSGGGGIITTLPPPPPCQQWQLLGILQPGGPPNVYGQLTVHVVGINPVNPPPPWTVLYTGCDIQAFNAAVNAATFYGGNVPQLNPPTLINPCCGQTGGGGGGGNGKADPCNPTLYYYDVNPQTGCPATTWDTCSCPPPQCNVGPNTVGPFKTSAARDAAAAAAAAACGGGGGGGGGGGNGGGGNNGGGCPPPVVTCPSPVVQCPTPAITVEAPIVNIAPPAISVTCGGSTVDVSVSQSQFQEQMQTVTVGQKERKHAPPPLPSPGSDPLERPVWIDSPAAFFWGSNAKMFRDQLWQFMGLQNVTEIGTLADLLTLQQAVMAGTAAGQEEREFIA